MGRLRTVEVVAHEAGERNRQAGAIQHVGCGQVRGLVGCLCLAQVDQARHVVEAPDTHCGRCHRRLQCALLAAAQLLCPNGNAAVPASRYAHRIAVGRYSQRGSEFRCNAGDDGGQLHRLQLARTIGPANLGGQHLSSQRGVKVGNRAITGAAGIVDVEGVGRGARDEVGVVDESPAPGSASRIANARHCSAPDCSRRVAVDRCLETSALPRSVACTPTMPIMPTPTTANATDASMRETPRARRLSRGRHQFQFFTSRARERSCL